MPTESARSSESIGKRKVKNKAPKRLRRKNKPVDRNTEENTTNNIPIIGNTQFSFDAIRCETFIL
jgi:hypothetical protein